MGSWCTQTQVEQSISAQELHALCDDDRDGNATKIATIVTGLRYQATSMCWGIIKTRTDVAQITALDPQTCSEGATGYPGLERVAAMVTGALARYRHATDGQPVPLEHPGFAFCRMIARGEADPC